MPPKSTEKTRTSIPLIAFLTSLFFLLLAIYFQSYSGLIKIPTFIRTPQHETTVHDTKRNITYVGTAKDKIEHFQNIFYAEDTSGQNRFAPPIKTYPSNTVIDAKRAGPWCPQGTSDALPFTIKATDVSENCLSLRIARPEEVKPDAKLPVVVWLHGGGHALGSAYQSTYEPDSFVKQAAEDERPVLWVAINYRLGFFGFATSGTLINEKQTNAGLRDQRAALEWVRDNIEAFGGDPYKVTAIGQGVGASDIGLHLTAYAGRRGASFQKAVMMSGAPGLNSNIGPEHVAENTARVAEEAGCVREGNPHSAATLACLREAPSDKLIQISAKAMRAGRPPFGESFFYPTYDGDFIRDRPSELMRAGRFVKGVPLISSWVANEGAWYAPMTTSTDEDVIGSFAPWLRGLSDESKTKLLELYPVSEFEHRVRKQDGPVSPQYYRAAQMNKDILFTCPILDLTWQYFNHGGVNAEQVRLYEHNATRSTSVFEKMGVPMWRVAHMSDIPYLLNSPSPKGSAEDSIAQSKLGKTLSSSITRFVNSGSPVGASDEPQSWPQAFSGASEGEHPTSLSLRIFGGPNDGPATLRRGTSVDTTSGSDMALESEKLFERCDLINSAHVREEIVV